MSTAFQQVGVEHTHETPERVGERPEWRGQLGLAAPVEHHGSSLMGAVPEPGGKPRLSDAQLAGQEHGVALASASTCPRLIERRQLSPAPDEPATRRRTGERARKARAPAARAGSQWTSYAATGPSSPFSSSLPTGLNRSWSRPSSRTTSEARIWLPSAAAQSRAASTTGIPK